MHQSKYISINQAARQLKCHVNTIRNMMERGDIKFVRVDRNILIIADSMPKEKRRA